MSSISGLKIFMHIWGVGASMMAIKGDWGGALFFGVGAIGLWLLTRTKGETEQQK